jgi:hypothetical protein
MCQKVSNVSNGDLVSVLEYELARAIREGDLLRMISKMLFQLPRLEQQNLIAIRHERLSDALLEEAIDHLAAGPLLPHILVFKVNHHVAVGPGLAENSVREPNLLLATHEPLDTLAVLHGLPHDVVKRVLVQAVIHLGEHHLVVGQNSCD